MFESFSTTTNRVPGGLGFNFDVVIVHIHLSNVPDLEISKLKADVKFIENNIKITSSRINVNEFKASRSFEFSERATILKDKLFKSPLECQVYYDGQSVGASTFLWPDSFINCIAGDCGRELIHCGEADIRKENEKVGRMEIIARLQIKCHEFDEAQILQPKVNVCNQTDNVINPNDVMFVVGEDKYGSVGCTDVDIIPASESGSSANATCLDLSDFRHINGKTIPNTNILESFDTKCCKTKNNFNQYEQMIENLLDKSKESSESLINKSKQQKWSCERPIKPKGCISESRFASCSSSETCQPFYCISDEDASESRSIFGQNNGTIERPEKRYCSLCHENITWLPKLAACPKCGFRPVSYDFEKPYDCKLTADKIIKKFANKRKKDCELVEPSSDISVMTCQQAPQCRCTCKNGQICAHCRVKKLCEDIFRPANKAGQDCGKCETNSLELYNICKTSGRDCRPYLAKVFQELNDLCNIKVSKQNNIVDSTESKKIETDVEDKSSYILQVNEVREKNQNKNFEENSARHLESNKTNSNDTNRKKVLLKNFKRTEGCKGKIFDYNNKREYLGTKIGHKTCLNGFAGCKNVPPNMGWLWNADTERFRTGWVPGAIRKPIKMLMQHFLNENTNNLRCGSPFNEKSEANKHEDYTQEPTLHLCKRNGVYYITLRPLKDMEDKDEFPNSHASMRPIQFKITKNPLILEIRKLKQCLKAMGFAKCICHKPILYCCCRSFLEKKKLEYQCCKECHNRQLPNCADTLVLSDTSESEAEFEFGVTPPAGSVQPKTLLKKRKKVSSATQYLEDDWKINQDYQKPLEKYFKLHNCAIGNRFGKAFGPYGIKGYRPGAAQVEGIYGPCGVVPERVNGIGRGGKNIAIAGPEVFRGPDGKFNMAQYLAYKALFKPSPDEIAERKRNKMALLKGASPPLLCMVDRRGKPIDNNSPCLPVSCDRACIRDNRIC